MKRRPTLILVPTEAERDLLRLDPPPRVCGFGPVVAAARAAQLVGREAPDRVVLLGIAGSYDPARFPLGTALEFSSVAIDGVGAGAGDTALSPARMGFAQLAVGDGSPTIGDEIDLGRPGHPALLTVCRAADSPALVERRRRLFPAAAVEDMEGFGVAVGCRLQGVPLRIIRGISNVAGDRAQRNWCIEKALAAARGYLEETGGNGGEE